MNFLDLDSMQIAIQTFREKLISYASMLMSCNIPSLSDFEMQFVTAIAIFRGGESDEDIMQRF